MERSKEDLMHIPSLLLALLVSAAQASITIGNPTSSLTLVGGSPVWVDSVLAHRCSGGTQTLTVQAVVGTESPTIVFDTDTFCSIDLELKWTPTSRLTTVPVGGFSQFKAASGGSTVSIDIDAVAQTATLL
jgi:hypothetical protein